MQRIELFAGTARDYLMYKSLQKTPVTWQTFGADVVTNYQRQWFLPRVKKKGPLLSAAGFDLVNFAGLLVEYAIDQQLQVVCLLEEWVLASEVVLWHDESSRVGLNRFLLETGIPVRWIEEEYCLLVESEMKEEYEKPGTAASNVTGGIGSLDCLGNTTERYC